jgi:hypothetical protein
MKYVYYYFYTSHFSIMFTNKQKYKSFFDHFKFIYLSAMPVIWNLNQLLSLDVAEIDIRTKIFRIF